MKNFLGNTKHFLSNLIIAAGENGICCYESDGGNGYANHIFANNTCWFTGPGCMANGVLAAYGTHCAANITPDHHKTFRSFVYNNSFMSYNNSYFGEFRLRPAGRPGPGCPFFNLSLSETQQLTQEEINSTQTNNIPDSESWVHMARILLHMQR
eukprot:SAG31_NODE_1555_length_7895_cov_46.107748_5_plen_154_part_00